MATASLKGVREGSRWLHQRPPSSEVAEWFTENVRLHDGMDPLDFVTGVTLIPAIETTRLWQGGANVEEKRQTFTPYVKVESRVDYFWKLMELRGTLGVVETVPVTKLRDPGYFNLHLPEGFFIHPVQNADGKFVSYIGMSFRVTVYERDMRAGGRGRALMEPAFGTKMVPMLGRYGPDDNAIEKAQTGAKGRALGMAGMLVIPGSGVATAEDMEGASIQPAATPMSLPAVPGADTATGPPPPPTLQRRAADLLARLHEDKPERAQEFEKWAIEAEVDLSKLAEMGDAKARGVVRQLEKKLAQ